MNNHQLREYNKAQRIEIFAFKWTESEKAGHDLFPGFNGNNDAAFIWIRRYAQSFRIYWVSTHEVKV